MIAEKFQICSFKITGKYICESKNWIYSFLLMPKSKTLPQIFIIIPQTEGNCLFLPNSIFWRYYGVEKITKINKGIDHKFW